uniref:Uncharacterized protein n=1 Tax=Glossina palpalis gambiensis TaxID=67801 RepID=A0A1B0B8H5_9MUSC
MLAVNSQPQSLSSRSDATIPEEQSQHSSFFDSQIFRWLSLILYMSGISGLGMILSLYYLIFFDSRLPEIYTKFPISLKRRAYINTSTYKSTCDTVPLRKVLHNERAFSCGAEIADAFV